MKAFFLYSFLFTFSIHPANSALQFCSAIQKGEAIIQAITDPSTQQSQFKNGFPEDTFDNNMKLEGWTILQEGDGGYDASDVLSDWGLDDSQAVSNIAENSETANGIPVCKKPRKTLRRKRSNVVINEKNGDRS